MKLFECFSATGFHTCIATTFDLDFVAFESMALTRLREARSNNIVVIADARMVALSLENGTGRPKYAGRRYSVVDGKIANGGVYHSKLILQLGRKSGRLIIGSANLTAPGLAGNLEMVGEVSVDEDNLTGVPLLRAAMSYMARTIEPSAATARRQIEWAVARTPWLRDGVDSSEPISDDAGGLLALLPRENAGVGIAERFRQLIGEERVKRLVVMSPYWDDDLAALKWLKEALRPTRLQVVLQPATQLFPVHAVGKRDQIEIGDIGALKRGPSRFAHAKLLVAQTARADHVLYGSANCTTAALGNELFGGRNEEVSLYRRLKQGSAVQLLELEPALSEDAAIALSDLPPQTDYEEIALDQIQPRMPGRFEVRSASLLWWPRPAFDVDESRVELFDANMLSLGEAAFSVRLEDCRCMVLDGDELPGFARVRLHEQESSLAVVTVDAAIHESQRRPKSSKIRNALEHFDDEDATEGLWLLEVIDEIHRAEAEETQEVVAPSGTKKRDPQEADPSTSLSYEEFIKGRRKTSGTLGNSTTATSYMDAVRSALNYFLGRGKKASEADDEEASDVGKLLDMGDETADGEGDVELGHQTKPLSDGEVRAQEAARRRARERQHKYYRDTADKIVEAVTSFSAISRSKAESSGLAGIDLLRLRALLMVVLTAGTRRTHLVGAAPEQRMSRVQVLPIEGDTGWPRLATRLLYEFFRRSPVLAYLVRLPEDPTAALPVDVVECWATCAWAACAVQSVTDERGKPIAVYRAGELAQHVYRTFGLTGDDLTSDAFVSVMEALSDRLASRLGVNADSVRDTHLRLVGG
ncbi:hypothetical protein [Cupriavidus sp. UYPR2.512]|uniref:hypothetical protein n=1 Tax=Cupriavidus sp. UYPR2.512 TaxID=1080187 RepID=UPI00037F7C1F|nr:hypothetical protein [Cupriavidus sp. UYPR2.512]UIF86096.1 hypothetical protein KAF44_19080 [Cupriavidus necator]